MKVLLFFLLAIVGTLSAPADVAIEPQIIGGVNALPGEFPYIVSLQWVLLTSSQHVCGGVILNNIWILSAAHCLTELPNLGRVEVLAGKHNLAIFEDSQVRVGIDRPRSIIHPDWRAGGVGPDDLALIRLASPLTFTARIQPARLPAASANQPTGPATLAGWGTTSASGGGASNILQKAIMPIITVAECQNALNDLGLDGTMVDNSKVCTGPLTGGVSACSGDSGGPLLQGSEVVGIVSWGVSPCGSRGAPSGVFKRVSAYIGWINGNTGINPS